jgi:hypothetical protein
MWTVFKYRKNYNFLISNLKENLSDSAIFYNPRVEYSSVIRNKKKIKTKYLLTNYAFCYSNNFKDKNYFLRMHSTKGLEYFLKGYFAQQKEIKKFINYCKSNENKEGNLSQSFFSKLEFNKAKFLSGPFSNMVFDILLREKNKLRICLNDVKVTLSKNSKNVYSSIY